MSKNNVNPNHYKVAGRDRQGEDILQERHKQKHARSLARERFEPRGITPSPAGPRRGALVPGPPPPGPSAKSTAKQAPAANPLARKKAATSSARAATAEKKTAKAGAKRRTAASSAQRGPANVQASDKRGKRSTAQKRGASRNDFESMPATRPVAGAHGKTPSAKRRGEG